MSNKEISGRNNPSIPGSGGLRHGAKHPGQSSQDHFPFPKKRPHQRNLDMLKDELEIQRQINQKLLALNQFGQDLDVTVDKERVTTKMARLLVQLFQPSLVGIYEITESRDAVRLVSSAGPFARSAPTTLEVDELSHWGIQDSMAAPQEYVEDPLSSPPTSILDQKSFPSTLILPISHKQELEGMILIADGRSQFFSVGDEWVLNTAASRLGDLWAFSHRGDALIEFVQSVGNLSMVQETTSLMEMIASIARRTLDACFCVVAAFYKKDWLLRSSGKAPVLFESLQSCAAHFLDAAIKTPYTFRLRDLRTDPRSSSIELDTPDLCCLLASPIVINGNANFILLAFGKNSARSFSEEDVFLADLLSAHAAQNLGSCFIHEQLRDTLLTTQLLNDLNGQISQVENLNQAASVIANTAFQLTRPRCCGMVLFALDGRKEADVIFPYQSKNDLNQVNGIAHPYSLIQQAMNSRQTIYLAESEPLIQVAIPIHTQRRCYGVLWLEMDESLPANRYPAEDLIALVNQSTIGLERFILLEETRTQSKKLIQTYTNLEESYDQTLKALMRALDARDRETEGHSERVANLAVSLGQEIGLSKGELKALTRGSLLHDIGKIGISDKILLKEDSLTDDEWDIMRQHPQIGANIIQEIPALNDALQVIAFHQERWNGSGYPYHLSGKDIPLVARIFAVIDVYDALTSNRPYRPTNLTSDEAIRYLRDQAGVHFDPEVVDTFARMIDQHNSHPANTDPDTGEVPTHII